MFEFADVSWGPLAHVDARIDCGLTAITGASGSGKSTLLRLMTKLVVPEGGTLSFRGRDVREWEAVALRRQVAMVAQETWIWPGTVAENLTEPFRLRGLDAPEMSLVLPALDLVGLDAAANTNAATLSGGEKARLALARSLVCEPAWALWDEPTAALDNAAALALFGRIRDYARGGNLSLVFVTHDPALVAFADHHLVVRGGSVEAGSPP